MKNRKAKSGDTNGVKNGFQSGGESGVTNSGKGAGKIEVKIRDKKLRGEWAESVFMVRAGERGLQVSKPWGDSRSYDFVVGRPGHFVAVQVKCTIAEL